MTTPPTVALLGLGTMGQGMAANLLAAGLSLRVWNRRAEKAARLGDQGAYVADSPGDAVTGADLVVTMLFDEASVAEVVERAASYFAPDAIWVQTSTVGVAGSSRLAELAERIHVTYVDAPVLGTKQPAAAGALVVLASGPDRARERCEPVFAAIGARTLWVGEANTASRLKLVANAWVLSVLEGVAEAITLANALGLDPHLFFAAIEGGALDAPYVKVKGTAMIDGRFEPAFSVDGAAKDAGLILDAAREAGLDLPFVRAAREYLNKASAAGHGSDDMAAIVVADRQL